MYKDFATYYDDIYSFKNYKKESDIVHSLINKYKLSGGNLLLDITCGTGTHIFYLKKHYKITGVDLSKNMLKIVRQKNQGIKFINGDIRKFQYKNRFDVVITLFSSIAHLENITNLKKAVKNLSSLVIKGGIVIIEPFIFLENFLKGKIHSLYIEKPDLHIARFSKEILKSGIMLLELHHLINDKKHITYFVNKFKMAMYSKDKILEIMSNSGFKTLYLENGLMKGRGLFIGVKQ